MYKGGLARKQYVKNRRDSFRNRGLCPYCGEPPIPDSALCARHFATQQNRKKSLKSNGRCVSCLDPAIPGRVHCQKHRDLFCKNYRAMYKQRKDAGLCVSCGKIPVPPKATSCILCKADAKDRARKIRANRLANGLCAACGKGILLPSCTCCESCFFKRMSHDHFDTVAEAVDLRELFAKQHGRCAYSGLILTLGVNASLDHRVPVSQKGPVDISNVHWVHAMVNQMKWGYSEAEFLQMVRDIYHHVAIPPSAV